MLNTKERAFSFGALIQKTRDYFKAEKLWWGKHFGFIPITSEWTHPTPTSRLYSWIKHVAPHKAKYALHNFIEVLKFVPTCIFNSWKIPSAIMAFQDAMYQAEREQREQIDTISKLEEQLESAVEDIIDARHGRFHSVIGENIFSEKRGVKFLDVSHKDYEEDLEDIRSLYEERYGLRIPDGFLSEEAAEDRMWEGFDRRYDGYPGEDDFDYFRFQIDKSFYDSSKVWNEEILPKLEEEKKWRDDHDK